MNTHPRPLTLSICAALAWTLASTAAQATVTSVIASNVNAYFGAYSDIFQESNPLGLNPWPAVGVPVPTATFLPGVPAYPASTVIPSNATPFAPTTSNSYFGPSGVVASSSILGFAGGGPSVDDAQIALSMYLFENGGYAYEQLNYDIDYGLTNSPTTVGVAGALANIVTRSFSVSGIVNPAAGSFVQFGGQMDFWEENTNSFLGTLTFNYLNTTPGFF